MKILLLSDPNSVHTSKWAQSLAAKENEIVIFGLGDLTVRDYENNDNISIVTLNQDVGRSDSIFSKLKYLKALPMIKKLIRDFQPDILHAHFASSYGLLGALAHFHPFVLSVWGYDVFEFPRKSFIHKMVIEHNLKKADKILSTSHVMAKETALYTDKKIEVTPFGVNMQQFQPKKVNTLFEEKDIVIGTIKTLEEKYGIRYLIQAFKILVDKYSEFPLKLLIVGGGSLKEDFQKLVVELHLNDSVIFVGKIPFDEVPHYHNMLNIYVALSVEDGESFGVAIVEASACGNPVVVSDVGGLPEVVEDSVTGIVVPPKNAQAAADAIEKLILDRELREKMGRSGVERVKKLYNWNDNVKQMMGIYKEMLDE